MNFEFTDKAGYQEYFGRAHDMARRSVKEFVVKEILPHVDDWEEMGEFPRELYQKAGDVGILGIRIQFFHQFIANFCLVQIINRTEIENGTFVEGEYFV